MSVNSKWAAWACSGGLVLAMVGRAHALDFAYEASLGAGHSDNIGRTPTNEQSETIASAGLRFSLDQVSSRVQAHSVADFAYLDYLDNTYDADFVGNAIVGARFEILPERFEWHVADNFGQVLSDPFAAATPDNRENINYFSTGPGFTFPIGARNFVRADARYSKVNYEDSPFDSDSVSGQLGVGHVFSSASRVSLLGRKEDVDFTQEGSRGDYKQTDAFIQFSADGARTHLAVDAGYTELELDDAESQDGLLLRVEASRRLSGSSTAVLSAGREFANSGSAFAMTQTSGSIGLDAAPGRQTELPFTHDHASLGWNFSRNRTSFGLSLAWYEDSYEQQDVPLAPSLDQSFVSLSGLFSRQISARTNLQLQALYGEGEFDSGPGYDELNAGASIIFRASRRISVTVEYEYYQRNSDVRLNEGTENRIWLSIGYGNGTPRRQYAEPEFAIDQRI